MGVIILFCIILSAVFFLSFVFGRRFGPLALSLAAGSMLANFWSSWLAGLISDLGVKIAWLPNGVISALILTMLPLFVLLLGGPKYSKKHQRIISALAIAVFTAALLVVPLGRFITLDSGGFQVYKVLNYWWKYIVSVGLILGLVDLFLLHGANPVTHKK